LYLHFEKCTADSIFWEDIQGWIDQEFVIGTVVRRTTAGIAAPRTPPSVSQRRHKQNPTHQHEGKLNYFSIELSSKKNFLFLPNPSPSITPILFEVCG
jgi:hypothetical protein